MSRTLKVLHVIPGVADRYGGPSRAVLEMCRALNRCGVQTRLATTDADGDRRLPVALGSPVEYQGVSSIFFRRQWSEAFKYSRPLARWLDDSVAEYDLVHIHAVFSHSSLAAGRACRRHGVPYIVRPLGSLDPWALRQKRVAKEILWKWEVGRLLENAATIHYEAATGRIKAEKATGLNSGVVIPLGVDLSLPAEDRPPRPALITERLGPKPYCLVLSRLHPVKRLELLIRSFLAVAGRPGLEDWRLVIAGSGDSHYVAGLHRLVGSLGGETRVLFVGWLGGDEKVAVLSNASLLAQPSQLESFGLSSIEAMACGVPVLVSSEMDLAESIGEAEAGWVAPLELAGLQKTLQEALASSEEERSRRGGRARKLATSEFAWPAVADRLVELYEGIVLSP